MYGNDVYDYAEDVLSHHGILGMKWGVRRTPEQLGHRKEQKEQKREEAQKKKAAKRRARAIKKGDYSSLSDQEMQKRINRLRMEQEYNRMSSSRKRTVTTVFTAAAAAVGGRLLSEALYNGGKYVVKNEVAKWVGYDMADILFPKKKPKK